VVRFAHISMAVLVASLFYSTAHAATATFFHPTQIATLVTEGTTWDKIQSDGYYFTYTRDKLFAGGLGGEPIGSPVRVPWPQGVEAQTVTAGPNPSKAKITIERVDGDIFDFTALRPSFLQICTASVPRSK